MDTKHDRTFAVFFILDMLVWALFWLGPVALLIYFDFPVHRVILGALGGLIGTFITAGITLMLISSIILIAYTIRRPNATDEDEQRLMPYIIGAHAALPFVVALIGALS